MLLNFFSKGKNNLPTALMVVVLGAGGGGVIRTQFGVCSSPIVHYLAMLSDAKESLKVWRKTVSSRLKACNKSS